MSIITVFNQKDGVGKTTTALNLLAGIARRKQRPMGIDLDPQAHLSRAFGARPDVPEESVHSFFMQQRPLSEVAQITASGIIVCPAHHELAALDGLLGKGLHAITRLRAALRHADIPFGPVVIDCGALFGVLALNAIFACDVLLVPVSADYLAFAGAQRVERALHAFEPVFKRRLPRRYVLTRYDATRPMCGEVAELIQMAFRPEDICKTRIAETSSLAETSTRERDSLRHAPDGHGADNYPALVEELVRAGFVA